PQASAVLVTTSENLARKVATLVQRQWKTFPRKEIMERVIRENLWIITATTLEEALGLVNSLAPEHLEVIVKEPGELLERVENAGAIFLGAYSPVAVGDYVAGSNHVLPTGGMAKSFSGLSLRDFMKSIDVVNCSKDGLEKLRVAAETLAGMEGLEAHRRSVEERFRK
ncbi:MAG TPA: histidinol dehydrogenase, partial [Candidatus Bathyarchaeia archaeon]|nr:histidinol dehydrogenase [Candidatus Bathyarchaeia archaeon]